MSASTDVELDGDAYRMLAALLRASHLATLEDVPGLVAEHAATVGLTDPVLYVVDLRQENLVALTTNAARPERLPVDGSLAGRAFRDVHVLDTAELRSGRGAPSGPRRVWAPLLDGTERLGVVGVTAVEPDRAVGELLRALSSLVALMIVSKRSHSDTYARLVRSQPTTISAEIIQPLMPPLTVATEDLVVCAQLEPAYEVGGDVVDFSMAGSSVHLSIFDAMGHDQSSGLTTSIATATCRNRRRQGADPVEISKAIDSAVASQFGRSRFVTGVLAQLDRETGILRWVNRGHPPPLLIRGGRWLSSLRCPTAPPMGLELSVAPTLCRAQLQPGDRLLFYTDGVVEARDEHGEPFGLRRFTDLILRKEADGCPPPETLRRLMRTLLEHQHGRLQDDATVMLVEWRSDQHRRLLM